jgi:hypothetical protein
MSYSSLVLDDLGKAQTVTGSVGVPWTRDFDEVVRVRFLSVSDLLSSQEICYCITTFRNCLQYLYHI